MSEKKRRLPNPATVGSGAASSFASASKKSKLPTTTKTSSHAHSHQSQLKPDFEILASLQKFHFEHQKPAKNKTLTQNDLNLTSKCRGVSDLDASSISVSIERVILDIAHSILGGHGFSFDVPSRSVSNQMYVTKLDQIVLKDKSSTR